MGITPIDHKDIHYYSLSCGLEFIPIEINKMIEMSRAYVNQSYDKNPRAKRPYKSEVQVQTASSLVESLKKISIKKN